jgi:hypothetical protein
MHTRKPSPALVIACAALFIALGGTAIAAGRYVISDTNQIKPSVLSALVPRLSGHYIEVVSPEVSLKPGQGIGVARAECPRAGALGSSPVTSRGAYHLVSGGYAAELAPGAKVTLNKPAGANAWEFIVNNHRGSGISGFRAFALCAPGSASIAGGPGSWSVNGTE